jgi:hypothetical protein
MATSLLQRGHDVVGFDVWAPTLDKFRLRGGQVASSPRQAARDLYILMVATAKQVETVLFDESDGAAFGVYSFLFAADFRLIDSISPAQECHDPDLFHCTQRICN